MKGPITRGQILKDLGATAARQAGDPSTGVSAWALGICEVVGIEEDDYRITLKPVSGSTNTDPFSPVDLTLPGAGARHMLGAMPEIGDLAVVGWLPRDSKSYRKVPVIVGWMKPDVWLAHQWASVQTFSPEEIEMTPKLRSQVEGIFGRRRHKAPRLKPGNVAASSSQGSDLLLDESVTLSNRRANEVVLRDQDQALVTRSLQRFMHEAGTTTFSGTVQRDATLLPRQLFSDGRHWHPDNVDGVMPETDTTETDTQGYLQPADALHRKEGEDEATSELSIPAHLDPYEFLQKGLFIDEEGYLRYPESSSSNAVYGGKPYYRVSVQSGQNAAINPNNPAFTEHRVELAHTTDGTLPVGVQTDGLDVDKLGSPAYLEVAYGTVVGNDASTDANRQTYGQPLHPRVNPNPVLESAVGRPIKDQAAALFRLTPPKATGGAPAWWSVQKDGRVKFNFTGSGGHSVEGALTRGASVRAGGTVHLGTQGVHIDATRGDAQKNHAFEVISESGAVAIFAGGVSKSGITAAQNSPEGEGVATSIHMEGKRHVQVRAGGTLILGGAAIQLDSNDIRYSAQGSMLMQATDGLNMGGQLIDVMSSGQATYTFGGPYNGKDSNGPPRKTQFTATAVTGATGGVVDEYKVAYGGRYEEFTHGDHETKMTVGNMQYTTDQGQWGAKAAQNNIKLDDQAGMLAYCPVGDIEMETAGAGSVNGDQSVMIRSVGGPAQMRGQAGVHLGAPGLVPGSHGIVNGSDLDPLTGKPLSTYGMGAPNHRLQGFS